MDQQHNQSHIKSGGNMSIKLNIKTQIAIRQLGKKANLLQIVAADTVNESAEDLKVNYVNRLERKQRLRNKRFTLGAVKINKSNPIRKSGQPRPLGKINSIVGVRKMKGGKKHYLAKLEEGVTQRGNRKTKSRVPIPLTTGRTSQNINKPIAAANRLTKGDTQTLRAGGKAFGVKGDRFRTSKQRFAVLYKYKKSGGEGLTGDLKKPFFFIDNSNRLGIFKFIRGQVRKIRTLEQSTARTKPRRNFKKTVDDMKPADIQRKFIRKAERVLK